MTVFDEICGTRVQYVFRVCYLNDSIDFLPLTDYKKNKPVEKMRRMSSPKPSISVIEIQAKRGSQLVPFTIFA